MRLKLAILVTSWMLFQGCTSSTSVYVLEKEELVRVHKGQPINATFDGWVISDRATQRVLDAKIKGVNLK